MSSLNDIHNSVDNKLRNALYCTVCDALSANSETRRIAEEKIKAMEVTQEFGVHLIELSLQKEVSFEVRQMCTILLKKYIESYWSGNENEEEQLDSSCKSQIKKLLISGLKESNSKIRNAFAYCIAFIGSIEWPEFWPTLFDEILINEDESSVSALVRVLEELIKEVDNHKAEIVVPVFIDQVCSILEDGTKYSTTIQMEAVHVLSLMVNIFSNDKQNIRQILISKLAPLCELFVSTLRNNDKTVTDYGLKTNIIKFLTLLVQKMSKHFAPYLNLVLPTIWSMVMNYGELYTKSFVYDRVNITELEDMEGKVVGFTPLVLAIFDFIHSIVDCRRLSRILADVLTDILYYDLIFMHITKKMEENWLADPINFTEDNSNDCFDTTVRLTARDVLMMICHDFESELVVPAICHALNRHLSEATSFKRSGVCDWWKIHEVCMYTLGLIKDLILAQYKTGTLQFDLVTYIDMWQFTFQHTEYPLLLGRCIWFGGKYSIILQLPYFNNYMQTTLTCIVHNEPVLRIFAIRAIIAHCEDFENSPKKSLLLLSLPTIVDGLIDNLSNSSYFLYLFLLSLQTLKITLSLDKNFTLSVASRVVPLMINLFIKYNTDPTVVQEIREIIKEFCHHSTSANEVQEKFIPILVNILNMSNEKVTPGLQAVTMDILHSIIKGCKPPLSNMLVVMAFPAAVKCVIRSDDQMLMQSGGECLRCYLLSGAEQISNYTDSEGKTGLEYILQATSQLLDPLHSEAACNQVGKLIITIIHKAGSVLGSSINFLLRAILSKMQRVEKMEVWQSLLIVFAYLFYTQAEAVVSFLTSVPGPTGVSALEFVLKEWINRQPYFTGYYEHNLSIIALSKLLEYSVTSDDNCFDNIMVSDQLISKNWTKIPALGKAFKIIVNELSYQLEANSSRQEKNLSEGYDSDNDSTGSNMSNYLQYELEPDHSDQLYTQDPVFQIDILNHLTDFIHKFKTVPRFHWFINYLTNEEKSILASLEESKRNMLPTTGYFKSISCPFFDACICERPYCHYKHSKREAISDSNLISELVSKAVHKVLNVNTNLSSNADSAGETSDETASTSAASQNVTYNPTPISELNKYKNNIPSSEKIVKKCNRHIPIQYTPERPVRSVTTNYSTASEYVLDDPSNTNVGYSPTPRSFSSISYIPSSIKILSSKCSTNDTSQETENQSYVPSKSTSNDSQTDLSTSVLNVKYSPTRNLDINKPDNNEYVPNYTDELDNGYIPTGEIPDVTQNEPNKSTDIGKSEEKPVKKHSNSTSSKSSTSKDKKSGKEKRSSCSKYSDKDKHSRKHKDNDRSNGHSEKQKSSSDKRKLSSDKHKTSGDKHKSNSEKRSHRKDKSTSDRYKSSSRSDKNKTRDKMASSSRKDKRKKKDRKEVKLKHESSPEKEESILLDDSSDFDSDDSKTTLEECRRIFEEYLPPLKELRLKDSTKPVTENVPTPSSGKKRVAHEKSSGVIRETVSKPKRYTNAAMIMANRYNTALAAASKNNVKHANISNVISSADDKLTQERKLAQVTNSGVKRPLSNMNSALSSSQAIINAQENSLVNYQPPAKSRRIAHVPNVYSLLNAKKKVEEIAKTQEINKTPVQTVAKGTKRVAHVPELSLAELPTVLKAERSKLPVNVRTRYLHLMINECVKLYMSKEAAYERALNEELNCYMKCSAVSTYRNSAILTVNRLRKEMNSDHSEDEKMKAASNAAMEFVGEKFYTNVQKWILTEEELLENGYPRPRAERGRAAFKDKGPHPYDNIPEHTKICARCNKMYEIDEQGKPLHEEDCTFHFGRRYYSRGESIYACCREISNAGPCSVAPMHVFEYTRPSEITGYVCTLEPESNNDKRSTLVYALDCEMVYTTRGVELARVTVVDVNNEVVYESLVRPLGEILDYNTRFSGITDDQMIGVTTNIINVQAALLLLFNSKTILIGHSLENDLIALRMIHERVIDTSILFPHKMGPPRKLALKALASQFLGKIIQDDEAGHDSTEDAITCMQLVLWKLKEDMKTR